MKKDLAKLTLFLFCSLFLLISSCKKEANKVQTTLPKTNDALVSQALAEQVGLQFITKASSKGVKLLSSLKTSSGNQSKTIDHTYIIKGSDETTDLYVINFKPSGFVVISGTKYDSPVLAFSDVTTFNTENMHPGLKEWIDKHKTRIEGIRRKMPATVSDSVNNQWVSSAPPIGNQPPVVYGGTVNELVGPLLQTTWSQGYPYNQLLTTAGNDPIDGLSPTGCVATAMAQIMKFWSYPATYNWSIMPSSAYSSSAGSLQIAQVMKDAGYTVGMSYGYSESGADASRIAPALINNFGYAPYAGIMNYNSETSVVELDAGHPMIFTGTDPTKNEGHAWVCDGYERNVATTIHDSGTVYQYNTYVITDFYLSMNWGWGGECNGWYSYQNFDPTGSGYDFTTDLQEVITIYP
ncbi:C10 family peptidase [Mucilaginibacter sp. E4BP6]|uniref:C10 family peptidase n=1 Tax=Mucilaginibacter sp. E4BP6 TaxID=2723089 RepID=UPI0015CECDBB|nr:C10 family peptidase [Mucilaginibacter sp. E4BP6]NYE68190.1 hypothetical protein [Mucilaginibacter sp. E4BP6]